MIQTAEVSITYKGDGVQTSFPYPYPYRSSDDIVGYIINDVGYEKRITNNFKYDKVSNIYQYPLAGEPLAAPYSIKLIRETPQQQNADLPGKLPFSLIEKSLDWIIMILQEIGSRCNSLWHIRNDCKLSETNARNSASSSAESEKNAANSEDMAKKWAMSPVSIDGVVDANSPTGYTQSSKEWALYSKTKAQEAATSATNAKSSETNAKTSETNAKTSKTNAKTSETNAKTSETKAAVSEANAKTSETNAKSSEINARDSASASASSAHAAATSATKAHNSETAAANSAKQAAESAGVFQDFTGATATTDGTSGKVPKPFAGQQEKFLKADGTWGDIAFQDFKGATEYISGTSGKVPKPSAGQQNKVLKGDGTWGDGVTPKTLWDGMHSYPENYVPADVSNVGWNRLGVCSIYYTQNKINNQPTQYGQLINLPADEHNESTQLWLSQPDGMLFSRSGNTNYIVNDTAFRKFATLDAAGAEGVDSQGDTWIRYTSGLQMCWNHTFNTDATWSYPVPFNATPTVQATVLNQNSVSINLRDVSNTRVYIMSDHNTSSRYPASVLAIGRWK